MKQEKDKRLLEVGDIIYRVHDTGINKLRVTRTTKTQAFCKVKRKTDHIESKFRREVTNSGYCYPIPSVMWSRTSYRVASEELDNEYKKYLLTYRVKKVDFDTLSTDQLQRILEIAEDKR